MVSQNKFCFLIKQKSYIFNLKKTSCLRFWTWLMKEERVKENIAQQLPYNCLDNINLVVNRLIISVVTILINVIYWTFLKSNVTTFFKFMPSSMTSTRILHHIVKQNNLWNIKYLQGIFCSIAFGPSRMKVYFYFLKEPCSKIGSACRRDKYNTTKKTFQFASQ